MDYRVYTWGFGTLTVTFLTDIFDLEKLSQRFLVLLVGPGFVNPGALDLEFNALPVEPPRHLAVQKSLLTINPFAASLL